MITRTGFSTLTALLCAAGVSAAGIAGYMTFTGKTVCSLVAGCDGAKSSVTTNVAAKSVKQIKEGACAEKACCSLTKLAKSKSATREQLDQAKSLLDGKMVLNARANDTRPIVLGASFPVAIPAAFIAAESCEGKAASGCCASKAKAVNAAATEKSGCCASKAAKTVAASTEKADSCCASKAAAKTVAASTEKADGCCASKAAKVVAAATEKSGCCAAKAETAKTVAASATGSEDGCCKGSGQRADGKACCGKCTAKKDACNDAKDEAKPVAEKTAETPAKPS